MFYFGCLVKICYTSADISNQLTIDWCCRLSSRRAFTYLHMCICIYDCGSLTILDKYL